MAEFTVSVGNVSKNYTTNLKIKLENKLCTIWLRLGKR